MRFLPWIEGQQFLAIYLLYAVFLILLLVLICNRDKGDYTAKNINEDEYYVLINIKNYNTRGMLEYFTFKLLSKGYIKSLDSVKGEFISLEGKPITELSTLESLLYNQYKYGNTLNQIVVNSELDTQMKNFYYGILAELERNGIVQHEQTFLRNKKISNLIMCALIIPGVWRIIGGITSGAAIIFLIYEVIGFGVIYFIISKVVFGDRVRKIGRDSIRYYTESYRRMYSSSRFEDIDFTTTNMDSSDLAAYFLLFGFGNEFFGPVVLNSGGVYHGGTLGRSCSSCTTSSCSSCSSDSDSGSSCSSCSGSSCSSCGGGCGGCGGGSD